MLETRLQLRLENGEPKCANCSNWRPLREMATVGPCSLTANQQFVRDDVTQAVAVTTDLTVCSKWAQKD
jgi:hypothetical protein